MAAGARPASGLRPGPALSAAQAREPRPMADLSPTYSDAISSIDEIIDDARNGRMFILVDHEDRENEGDLVIPAQMATPDRHQLHGHPRPRPHLPRDDRRAARRPRPAADGAGQLLAPRDRLHRLDRGARGGDDRHLRPRPRPHRRRRHRPALGRRRTSPRPATSSRCAPATAACSSAPATPRPPSTSPASPGSTPRASSAR